MEEQYRFVNWSYILVLHTSFMMKIFVPVLLITVVFSNCTVLLTDSKKMKVEKELNDLVAADQIAANIPNGKYKAYTKQQWNAFKDSVFTADKKAVARLFNKYGFLGFDKVGKEGSNHFWLIVQHCDQYPDFQKRVLKAMDREVKKGNADPSNYAYLYDRVQVNAGEKQMFGTQLTYEVETTGRAIPKIGLIDSSNVDRLRKEYHLEPLKDYLNAMTTMHYEMNKEHYQKLGIKEPDLY